MLRLNENIWSKSLVNSKEFAMFAVPNHYSSNLSYSDMLDNLRHSGVPQVHTTIQTYDGLATYKRGSASSFIKNIINQIFRYRMPNHAKNLKTRDNSTLNSTQPSETGKSQLQKLLQSALKKADEKEAENKQLKAELYRNKFFNARFFYFNFSLFEKNNPVDKCDWKKLYEAEIRLREAEK